MFTIYSDFFLYKCNKMYLTMPCDNFYFEKKKNVSLKNENNLSKKNRSLENNISLAGNKLDLKMFILDTVVAPLLLCRTIVIQSLR